jgi:hypothetical protein
VPITPAVAGLQAGGVDRQLNCGVGATERFEQHRPRLQAVSYRMLDSLSILTDPARPRRLDLSILVR